MIEEPQTTVLERTTCIVEDDADPDAPLAKEEKERLIDEEVIVIKQDPITSSIRKTVRHLRSIGGLTARYRGLSCAIVYHSVHSLLVNILCSLFNSSMLIQAASYVVTSVLLARLHMIWTHVMISKPSQRSWLRRSPSEKRAGKAIFLPSLVYALAQVSTFGLPVLGAIIFSDNAGSTGFDAKVHGCAALFAMVSMVAMAVLVLLPASVTLTRIEASFLPEDDETVVPFDRTLGGVKDAGISLDVPISNKSLFIEAWRSFDMASRVRLVKFYIKFALLQMAIVFIGLHVVMAQVWLLGIDRLTMLAQAGSAQIRLAAMGVEQD